MEQNRMLGFTLAFSW